MSTPELQIRISADMAEIKAALASLGKELTRTANAAEKTGNQAAQGMDRFKAATQKATTALKTMIGALGGFLLVKQLIQTADGMTLIAARIKLVSASTEDAKAAQEELFQIAQRTRSGLEETANLYVRVAQSVKGSGLNSKEILSITETVNQAVQLSGASAEAANAALIQLGQGLGSGTLRGEELNSVLEQTPRLADAIAEGMGKTRGELRELGKQGKLTGEQVIESLQNQKDVIAKEFAVLPTTVGQSLTKVSNSFKRLVGLVNESVNGTGGLAGIFSDFADFLSSPEVTDAILEFVNVFAEGMRQFAAEAAEGFRIISDLVGGIGDESKTLGQFLLDAFAQLPINVKTFVQLAVVEVAAVVDKLIANARLAKNAIKAIFTEATIDAAVAGAQAEIARIEQARDESVAYILGEREKVLKAGADARAAAAAGRKAKLDEGGNGKPKAGPAGPAVDEIEVTKAATQQALKDLETLYAAAGIGLDAYLQKRTDLELKLIDLEIQSNKTKIAAGGEGASAALTQVAILEAQKTQVLKDANDDRKTILEQYAETRQELEIQALKNQGKFAEAATLEIEAKYKDTLKRLKAEGDTAGVAIVEGIINREKLDAQLDLVKQDFDRTLEALKTSEQSIANQVQAGAISMTSGERNLQDIRQKSIAQLKQYLTAMEALAKASGDKEALKTIDEYKLKLAEASVVTSDFYSQVEDAATDSIVDGFMSLVDGSKSVGEAFRDMARQFALAVAQMIIQAYALAAVKAILSSFGGGGSVPVAHSGGIVGPGWGGVKRNVNPIIFAGAPRFHNGGVAGVRKGEVPAILQAGEEVLTRDDPRHASNGGKSGGAADGSGVRIINVLDPSMVSDAIGSASGERAIMNIIQRNASGITRLLR
jgi:tape measure domain-containing protein